MVFFRRPNFDQIYFFSTWVFFHEHSRFTGQQGKGTGIYLTPLYHFQPVHRHLDNCWAITAESQLTSAHSQQPDSNRKPWFPSASLDIRHFSSSTHDKRKNEGDCIGKEKQFVLAIVYLRVENKMLLRCYFYIFL